MKLRSNFDSAFQLIPHRDGCAVLNSQGTVLVVCESDEEARGLIDSSILESTTLLPKVPPRSKPEVYGGFGLLERRA